MSQGPSTLGTMITSSWSPISATKVVRSSSTHGESRALTRVQRAVWPRSVSLPAFTRPARAASLRSTGIASSRLPSRMSVFCAMSPALPTIFSLEKSRKWIILEGVKGISAWGVGAPWQRGLKKSLGLRIWGPRLLASLAAPMDTDQATREASGARQYGRYLEEFEVGAVYKHWPAKTVTEADDHLFCLITMNHHPLHINDVYAGD